WSGAQPVSGRLNLTGLNTRQTYTLTCTGSGGTVSQTVTVTAPPTVKITATPSQIRYPSKTAITLNWSSSNATSCTAGGGWSGTKPLSGKQTVSGLGGNQTYSLSCTGPGGAVSQSVTVTVMGLPRPLLTFKATTKGATRSLIWSSTHATSCMASKAWSGTKPVAGVETLTRQATSQVYTLTCTGNGGTVSKSVRTAKA
ncbi:MAG: hypothetical protein PHE55_06510, partial [Methylococcaceae bacterium]|nr:hypothetical protein [Methylococcaceae bacterium]